MASATILLALVSFYDICSCSKPCINECKNEQKYFPDSETSSVDNLFQVKEGFWKVCSRYTLHRKCVENCENSIAKELKLNSMKIYNFICEERYKEFKNNYRCIYESYADCLASCPFDLQRFVNKNDRNVWNITESACIINTCLFKCQTHHIYRNCGSDKASRLFGELLEVYLDMKKTILVELPESCLHLLKVINDRGVSATKMFVWLCVAAGPPAVIFSVLTLYWVLRKDPY